MMAKAINLLSVLAIILALYSFSETQTLKVTKTNLFKVVKVNGKILFIKSGDNLKTGDAYIDGTPLSFASNRDRAAIINKIKGRCILQPNVKGKAIVLPATSNIETRNSGALLNLLDVKNFFSDTLVFIGEVSIKMGVEAYQLDEKNFFYVTYMYEGEKIAKKLDYVGQELKISEARLFEIDGRPVPTFDAEMTLYYMRGDKPDKMSVFHPLFPVQKDLEEELKVMLSELEEMATDKKLDEVASYVGEFYGKAQKENLNDWLFETFGLGIKKETNFK